MFIESVPNRTSPPAVLLRESYRDEQGRAQKRTLANLSKLPGDVIATGTPPGVGAGMKPPKFLNVGDVVTLGIEGLGEQRQQIIAA